ncbi:hypothetical protein [Fodinicola feengrottensis]|uniref:hypothetical protein n=1 Tax=Fodinicola feengrottensis TaxID=435914 RepID=UPI0013CFD7C8|nr:hypothetical protein [Fodinicola feengrottensis]
MFGPAPRGGVAIGPASTEDDCGCQGAGMASYGFAGLTGSCPAETGAGKAARGGCAGRALTGRGGPTCGGGPGCAGLGCAGLGCAGPGCAGPGEAAAGGVLVGLAGGADAGRAGVAGGRVGWGAGGAGRAAEAGGAVGRTGANGSTDPAAEPVGMGGGPGCGMGWVGRDGGPLADGRLAGGVEVGAAGDWAAG